MQMHYHKMSEVRWGGFRCRLRGIREIFAETGCRLTASSAVCFELVSSVRYEKVSRNLVCETGCRQTVSPAKHKRPSSGAFCVCCFE